MKQFTRIKASLLFAAVLVAGHARAQVDTVEVRIFGGQRDDRGVRMVELAGGDVVALSTTTSTTDEQPQAWVHRFDSLVQPVWETTIADAPLVQPMDVVEHGAGYITVLGMRYANAADAYDWGWYTLDASGTWVSEVHWGTASWDIPARVMQRNDTLWTVGTSYATGGGDVRCTLHTWNGANWEFHSTWSWDGGDEEMVADAALFGDGMGVLTTAATSESAGFALLDAHTGEANWTYTTPFDVPSEAQAISIQGSKAIVLVNVQTAAGDRLAFTLLDAAGDVLMETIPGSGVNVVGRDVVWYSPTDFATLSMTEELGLGGEEWLYSRWSNQGAWQGGPTFGTQWDEVPAALLQTTDGRMWMLGATDGYSNGRDDVYLVVVPSAGIGNAGTYTVVETNIVDEAVVIDGVQPDAPVQVFPNPASHTFTLAGVEPSVRWSLVDASGREVRAGRGACGDVEGLGEGWYFVRLVGMDDVPMAIPLQVIR